ncbi:MAG: hypothetical protein ACTSR8_06065 [Promethearchaeota archaeon]
MPDVRVKTPNLDDIFEKWKQQTVRKNKKKMEKEFGTKGAVFSLDLVSAAEYVKDNMKEIAIYFAIKKTQAAAKGMEEQTVDANRLNKVTFYSFQNTRVNKDNWKGPDKVPMINTLKALSCKNCNGKGYIDNKCKVCKGTGKIDTKVTVLVGEEQKKETKIIDVPCSSCYGLRTLRTTCKTCGGSRQSYKYQILPVPIQTVVTGIPVLHSSAGKRYEAQIGEDLHKMIKEVDGITFKNFKELESKAEASLGYFNKNMKKTISVSKSDYNKYQKDSQAEIISQIYLFPMIQLFCETKRGSKFEIYSIGSGNKFIVYSDF